MSNKVLVSHPGKQYVHRLTYALQQDSLLETFFTTVWHKDSSYYYKLSAQNRHILKIYEKLTAKRRFEGLNENKIHINFLPEIIRQLMMYTSSFTIHEGVFLADTMHDKIVAGLIAKKDFDVFIGYENASYSSFSKAKALGKSVVLDLAQVHYKFIENLASEFPFFKNSLPAEKLRQKINDRKEQELTTADSVITLSSFATNTLVDHQISRSKIREINLGFDPRSFSPKDKYVRNGRLKLLYVSTVTQRKGVHLLLEAVKSVGKHLCDLTIVGPIADGHNLLDQYNEYFTYHSYVDHKELVKFYHKADLLVLPSYLDSWAMVVLEAMACGTPVIVSENTGSAQVVKNGGGVVIPVDSSQAIIDSINYFLDQPDELEKLGREAVLMSQAYTWETYSKKIVQFIESI